MSPAMRVVDQFAGVAVLVFGALQEDLTDARCLLEELGVVTPDDVHSVELEAVRLLEQGVGPGDARLARLVSAAKATAPADRPWMVASPGLATTLAFWRQVAGPGAIAVVAHRPVAEVVRRAATGRTSPAMAAARWEHWARQVLDGTAGMPTLVVRPAPGWHLPIAAFLAGRAGGASAPRPGALPLRGPPIELSAAQQDVEAALDSLVGAHPALAPRALPAETPSTPPLLDEAYRSEREREALERSLNAAILAIEAIGHSPSAPVPPSVFDSHYGLDAAQDVARYQLWLRSEEGHERTRQEALAASLAGEETPIVSLLLAAGGADPALLEGCLASVIAQDHAGWQLCVAVEDGPEGGVVGRLADDLAAGDDRGRVRVVPRLGPHKLASAVNAASAQAGGAFVAVLGAHDQLHPGALAEVAAALAADHEIDVLYTDEDVVDRSGARSEPRFKPDWSPDLLLSMPYVGRLLVVRRSLFEELEGLRAGLEGAEDYDLALRATERARRVAHVAVVAYHRRRTEGTDPDADTRAVAGNGAGAALCDAVARRGEAAVVTPGLSPGTFRVRRELREQPLVSVVVPFRDEAGLLARCVASLRDSAGYDRWEAVLVDNRSWEPETRALRRRLTADSRCRLLEYPEPFNWSAINNWAAQRCHGEVLLFLNNDVQGRSPGWLAALVEHAQRPDIGVVGARLVYPDGTVQHAGVLLGVAGAPAWHAFCFCPADQPGYLDGAVVVRNWSAVTGACLMVRRAVFEELGGFDETFTVCFNDIDFCLRARARGYEVVSTPFAELVHHESATRGKVVAEAEIAHMRNRWGPLLERDPYFNPNLSGPEWDLPLSHPEPAHG